MTVGNRIKDLRKSEGFSLDKLSKKSNCSKSYLWEVEKDRVSPSYAKVLKIAFALSVTAEFLLTGKRKEHVFESAFLNKFRSLSNKKQIIIDKIMDVFVDN